MESGAVLDERYEFVRELGRGGAGELVLVRDRKRDLDHCALKILKPRAHDPGLAPLFRSEFLLLSDVKHPSIVGVRDFGTFDSGESYFTMDYLPGENCRPFVEHDRLDAHEYVELAAGLLGALAHIHACGIVHRDVKPENVIMRRGGGHLVPCLIDFGLAVLSAASRSGEATGTLPYIAPEVLAGVAADPRSDLFSIGVLLFEVCTGQPPASRRELLSEPGRCLAPDRIRRNLAKAARGSVPRRFEDFVCRLTVPAPAGRLSSAVAALNLLRDMFGEEAVGAPVDVAVRPLASEAPLVGRGRVLAAMMARVEALQEGTLLDPIAVVAGVEGAGVTRLLSTVRNHASVSGCTVYRGASLRELVDDIAPGGPGGDSVPGQLVFRADAALHALAPDEAPMLVLDDVHRMNEVDCAALRSWISSLEGRRGRARLLLVLGGRSEGTGPGPQLLQTAGGNVPVELRELAPLTAANVRAALATITGKNDAPQSVVQSLHRASGGNARLLNELLGLLVQEGVLDLQDDEPVLREERLAKMRLPKGVIDAARRRLKQLDKGLRDILARCALVVRPLDHAAALALAGDRLADLLSTRQLVRDRGRVDFPHEAARAGADTLEGAARDRAVREVAEALSEVAPAVAAALWAQAGALDEARAVGVPAARELMGVNSVEEARGLLEAITGPRPTGEAGELLLNARYRSGRADAAARLGGLLLEQDHTIDVLMVTASALRESGQPEKALELLRGYEGDMSGETGARVINGQASMLVTMGRCDEALEASRRAEEARGSLIDSRGAIARIRANALRLAGRRTSAKRLEDRIIQAGDEVKAPHRASALTNRALFALQDGHTIAGIRYARAAGRLSGLRPWFAARVCSIVGRALFASGRPARAAALLARARQGFERAGMQADFARALKNEALALLASGRPTEADARLDRLESMPGGAQAGEVGPSARAERAFLAGNLDEAHALCSQRLKADGELGELTVQAARIVAASGDIDASEQAWRTALRQVWIDRRRDLVAQIRVGMAEWYGRRGAWRLAERTLDRCRSDLLGLRTSLRARAQVVRAAAAMHKQEPAAAGRRIEEAVAIANGTDEAPLIADVYSAAASLLEEGEMQRYLRKPTAGASAALLEAARNVWTIYGNETMLRKIDLHLSELPRGSTDAGGADEERLVKVLHIAREMNQEFDLDRLLQLILDRAIELTSAERGFVILLREGKADVHIARNIDRESLNDAEHKVSSQIISEVLSSGRIVRSEDAEDDDRFEEFLSVRQLHLKSVVAVPFRSGGRTVGALYLDNRFRSGNFGEQEERLLGLFADQATAAIDKTELIRETEARKKELEELYRQQKLELKRQGRELRTARREIKRHRRARGYGFDKIIGRSVAMQAVLREAKRVAASDLSVLVIGENGTGKEMLGMAMHYESKRQGMPCLSLNCAGYPGTLEAELFGHVRGAASGADRDRAGLFEEGDGGTLFLQEVSELDPAIQVRLLKTLESGEVQRMGDSRARAVDVRVIAACNSDLEEMVRNGRFREDLYYRLSGFVLRMPPLRDRLEDVEPLAYAFVAEAARREARPNLEISNDAIARLESYTWSGNVRELRSVIFRAVVTAQDDIIRPDDVAFEARGPTLLSGFDPGEADRVVSDLLSRGLDLNERHQTAIARILTRGKLAFGEYQRLFRVSKSTTARDLEGLLDMELLEKRGKTRAVVYLPGPKLREVAKKFGRG